MNQLLSVSLLVTSVSGFAFVHTTAGTATTALHMGLFDGVKDAFSAPALERTSIDSERETPIDRWMGWSVVSENQQQPESAVPANFVDAMDDTNYVAVALSKPMGIVFEENDADFGGIFVQSLKEGGVASENGLLQEGDQLVAVNKVKVAGMVFDDALGAIVEAPGDTTKLVFFRGSAKQFYGPTGANKEWVDEFVSKGGVEVSKK
ncbi:predicted protein [Phaeodactylum tricornutum CCAP 1055/1]|jgi:hypothetical protein|uniref:PDZ domain-containing protein n=1 Tax=Phaeodactylum tricornutum (strain CCAP 1055/1) TaxID=556484 RepID=B7GA35_PHATC|nr:predicted protein [Phaeodactylum tricornutum CCAP 1055/1]EEC44667.1 predicted protein [Phaeodactylum tricornutum CCAP 1055/1]|eukprot:XP_002183998.1 predicted protein [Phaeodactylum tricornutum CCAP 1055/1]